MKKLLAILLAGCMAFGMTACGGETATEDAPPKTPEEVKTEYIQSMIDEMDAAEKALDPQTRKLMKAMKNHLSAIRTEYFIALLGEKDMKKAEELLQRFEKAAAGWPSEADVGSERELIGCADRRMKEVIECQKLLRSAQNSFLLRKIPMILIVMK